MTRQFPAAAALVNDIARNYGLTQLVPDAAGTVRLDIDGKALVIAFSEAWHSVMLSAVLAHDAALPARTIVRACALHSRFAGRTTRVAREPNSSALVLVSEIPMGGLQYAAFAAAVQTFLADAQLARQELDLSQSVSGLAADHL